MPQMDRKQDPAPGDQPPDSGLAARLARVESERDRLLAVLGAGPQATAVTTPEEGRYEYVNRAFLRLTGYSREEVLGRTSLELGLWVQPGERRAVREALARGLPLVEMEMSMRRKDGSLARIIFSAALTELEGHCRVVSMAVDISARKRLEEDLARARARAEEEARAKASFLASMSHEIRTPLAGISGLAEVLSRMPLPESAATPLAMIREAAAALRQVIDGVLDLAKIESGTWSPRLEAFNPDEAARAVLRLLEPQASERGLELRFLPGQGLPSSLTGDPGWFRQILTNLVFNALKFTPAGVVEVLTRVLPPDTPAGTPVLEVEVRDTGPGVPPAALSTLFEPFSQAGESYAARREGTGLGLAISRRLARLLGGDVSAANRSEGGASFTLGLPLQTAQARPKPGDEPSPPGLRPGLRVLVVDDSVLIRMSLEDLLRSAGCEPVLASGGDEALGILASQPIDAVLLDVQMPGRNGLETIQAIRADRSGRFDPGLPVAALTAHALEGDRERLLEAGMDGYLSKPFASPQVLDLLARLTGGRNREV